MENIYEIPIWKKYTLSVEEAQCISVLEKIN